MQQSSSRRVTDRLDMASSLLLSISSSHNKHGEMIRAYLRHKLLTEVNNNNRTDSTNEIWSNLDHNTLVLVLDQADQTLNAQVELMTDYILARASDEASSNQR